MALTPHINDPNREQELKRIRKIAEQGADGASILKSNFNMDLKEGVPLPDEKKKSSSK